MKPVAIVDNTFLVYTLKIKSVNVHQGLRFVFDHILMPKAVVREFTPTQNIPENQSRYEILARISIDQGFYRLCTSMDLITYEMLKSVDRIDVGEMEIIAQSKKRSIPIVITDDKKALNSLPDKFSHIRFYNTITILAIMDLLELIPNIKNCLLELHEILNFKSADLRKAYIVAMEYTQRNVPKKVLQQKISLRWILN